jgi:hypothetical protein
LRNLCDHNKEKEPTKDDVNDLIFGTEKLLKRYFKEQTTYNTVYKKLLFLVNLRKSKRTFLVHVLFTKLVA